MNRKTLVILATLLGLAITVLLSFRPGLRSGEVYAQALATGHSLEQRPDISDEAHDDFILPYRKADAASYKRYTALQAGLPALQKVVRAVILSSPQPPAYYLAGHVWLKLFGAHDWSLRLLSLLCWLACLPLVWRLGARLGGTWPAPACCLLFTLNPFSWHYASTAGMATLVCLESLLLIELSLSLKIRARWTLLACLGLYTHLYFFFVFLACAAWIIFKAGPTALKSAALSLFFFIPWMTLLPTTLNLWRATPSDLPSQTFSFGTSPLRLAGLSIALNYKEGDSVLISGTPAGILGVTRYLPPEIPVAGWVPSYRDLNLRWDLMPKLEGSKRVFVVLTTPEDGRREILNVLNTTAILMSQINFENVSVSCFEPHAGLVFGSKLFN